jgi:GNAT superfamily N-acetyltransferase
LPEVQLPEPRVVELPNGTSVTLRPIAADDKEALERGFEALSERSRYRRFFSALTHLSDRQLAYFTEVDYVDHFAWVALLGDSTAAPGVGVARYIRLKNDPTAADIAVAVLDDYQGQGIGSLLLEALVVVALENGIERFVGHVLAENEPMKALLRGFGAALTRDEPGVYAIDLALPDAVGGLRSTPMWDVLRGAARLAGEPPQAGGDVGR